MQAEYYQDTSMPLPAFIQATVKKDLSFLIIPGQDGAERPAPELLEQAWLAINSEYIAIIGDAPTQAYADDLNRINELEARLLRLKLVVLSLREIPNRPALIDILKAEDFDLELDPSNPEQFNKDLDRFLIELIVDEIELEKLIEKMEEGEIQQKKADPPTESFFVQTLLRINRNEGVKYKASDLTVLEFAHLVKELKKSLIWRDNHHTKSR